MLSLEELTEDQASAPHLPVRRVQTDASDGARDGRVENKTRYEITTKVNASRIIKNSSSEEEDPSSVPNPPLAVPPPLFPTFRATAPQP